VSAINLHSPYIRLEAAWNASTPDSRELDRRKFGSREPELGGLILRSRTQAVKKMTSTCVWNIFLGVETVENSKTDLRSGKSVNARGKIWRF
jgi:hypothetical protein